MKILFLYPEMPETFWSLDQLVKLSGRKSPFPPLGLLTVSAMLPGNWHKKLVDLNVRRLKEADLDWADYVFISAMNVQADSAKRAIKRSKKKGKTVIAGGPLFTHQYEEFPEVDHFVLNEAELTLPEFIKDLEKGKPRKIYKTVEYADITKSPIPDWSLVNCNHYSYGIVQYSRGCPFLCEFCDVTALFGRKPRLKTTGQIIDELDLIIRSGTPDLILFADDNLIGNKHELKSELLPELISWRRRNHYAPGFATQATINLADDDELMRLMLEAGFNQIFIGIESPEEATLEQAGKKQNLNRNMLDNIRLLHSRGFIVTGGFIIGFDTESPNIYQELIDFISNSHIVIATVNRLKAPPGTALYDRMKQQDRLVDEFSFDEHLSNIKPLAKQQTLASEYGRVLHHVLTPANMLIRIKGFLREYREYKVDYPIGRKTSIRDISVLFRVLWYIGVLSTIRLYFFRLVIWTLWNMPSRIELALLMSGLMYHFHHLHKRYQRSVKKGCSKI